MKKNRMYSEAKTWNPYKGCEFDCIYCKPSFQAICKIYNVCELCKKYVPHYHPERLAKIPNAKIVFVCGNGDITFCKPEFVRRIIDAIKEKNKTHPEITYYVQSKNPICLRQYIGEFPKNVILITTIETNRDKGYEKISKAPKPTKRFIDFKNITWKRKVVTIEPVMDFDEEIFLDWMKRINPEYVWIGYNSRPNDVQLPEPSKEKLLLFIKKLRDAGLEVKVKDLRDNGS